MARNKWLPIAIIGLSLTSDVLARTEWEQIRPNLYYTQLTTNNWGGKLHAFKFYLKDYRLNLATSKYHNKTSLSVRQLVDKNDALFGINGGFFSPNWKPLGLRVTHNKIVSPFKGISWWGVAYSDGQRLRITSSQDYHPKQTPEFAVQCGPRLVVDGQTMKLKPGIAERSALCERSDGSVIISIVNNQPIQIASFAKLLAKPESRNGLECRNALNLDGGSSSQLYSGMKEKRLHLAGLSLITDAVLVATRKAE